MPQHRSRPGLLSRSHTRVVGHGLVLLAALSLAACFDKTPDQLNDLIDKGNATEALNDIEDLLQKQPASPVYHILALKARLAHCIQTNCPAAHPTELQAMQKDLATLKGPVNLSEKLVLNPQDLLTNAAPGFAMLPEQPMPLLSLLAITPEVDRRGVADALYTQPLNQLRTTTYASATITLQNFTRGSLSSLDRQWAGAMAALLNNNTEQAQSNIIGLRSIPATAALPATGAQLLPHILFAANALQTNPSDTIALLSGISATLAGWQIPNVFNDAAHKSFAQEANALRSNEHFLTHALTMMPAVSGTRLNQQGPGSVVTTLSPTVPLTDPGVALQLHLAALSLEFNPGQPGLWKQFLPLASRYVAITNDSALFAGLSLTSLPSSQQQQVVTSLFDLIQHQATNGQPVLQLLTQLGQLQLDKASTTKLEKLTQSGLETAITNQQLEEAMAYARFKPDLAKANRSGLLQLVIKGERELLEQEKFDDATALATLVNDKIGIDFNLDGVLVQEFQAQSDKAKLVDSLSSENPDWLLQPPSTVTLDLGPLWGFMQTYFSDQPKVLNDLLRNLVNSAHGAWGTPTAMYRLESNFDDTDFPAEARRRYLVTAITNSLINDENLTPDKRLTTAARLQTQFTELSLAPVVESALKHSTTLEQNRALWQQAPQQVRQVITAVKPQFANLMRGIDAWQSHDHNAAARAFASITDPSYADNLSPYLLQIGNQLSTVTGLYANLDAPTAKTTVPTLLIRVTVPAFAATPEGAGSNNTAPLTQLTLGILNRLGTYTSTAPLKGGSPDLAPLATSYATLRQVIVPVSLNLDQMTAPLSPQSMQRAAGGGSSFESIFGALRGLAFTSSSMVVSVAGQTEPVRFTRLLVSPNAPLFPTGRYSLTSPLSTNPVPGEDTASLRNLLPPGSLLTLKTAEVPNDDGTWAVSGELWHPGLSQPQTITGSFNPQLLTTDLSWLAPLASGGNAKAIGRCQTVPGHIVCGAHYVHAARQQFAWRIAGAQTAESLATTRQDLAQRNKALLVDQPAGRTLVTRLASVPLQFVSRTSPLLPLNGVTSATANVLASATTRASHAASSTVVSGTTASSTSVSSTTSTSGTTISSTTPISITQVIPHSYPVSTSPISPAPTPSSQLLAAPSFNGTDATAAAAPTPHHGHRAP